MSAARSLTCLLFVGLVVLASAACGSSLAPCESSKCAPGNQCIVFEGVNRCRKTCTSNTDPTSSCPFGYICKDAQAGGSPFCVQSTALTNGLPLTQRPTGQWGFTCDASKTNADLSNPDCDGAQGFLCYGQAPTDAQAYCTRYDCTKDDDCGPGFWCGQVNQTPNAAAPKRTTFGQVRNVCLRRDYCATCTVDLDCPDIAGTKQHCIPDEDGKLFCTSECLSPGTCRTQAKCIPGTNPAINICYPRAKKCVGDGSLCAECRVDTDCGGADGVCLKGDYTDERACAKKVATCNACPSAVPPNPDLTSRKVGCLDKASDTQPANYCFGVYSIAGSPSDIGCFSPDR
jgi:hypothetical protein